MVMIALVAVVLLTFYASTEALEQLHLATDPEECENGTVQEGSAHGPSGAAAEYPYNRTIQDCYDFVIVGGGSAGSIIANRLAANRRYSVLVLEAGGEETPDLAAPFLAPFLKNANNSWFYATVPQKNACLSFPHQMGILTLGKILGGTSSINSMNFVRGSRHDFDRWENVYNATGWSYEEVLPLFKNIENFNVTGVSEQEKQEYHGFCGDIPINYASYNTQLSYHFLSACEEANYSYIDYNGRHHTGCSRVQSNTAGGARMSANTCFLKPVLSYENLQISLNSVATKIVFNSEKQATDVQFMKDGVNTSVRVGREVILSAGAIGSPQLLMLSGIGPTKHLEHHGIQVVADLPVGQGLQDHIIFLGLVINTDQDYIGLADFNESIRQYYYNQTGLITIPGAFETLVFMDSGKGKDEYEDYPDIENELTDLYPDPQIKQSPYVSDEIYEKYYKPMFNKTGFMNAVALVRPKSRGSVMLNSSHYAAMPLIDPQFFSVNEDLERLVAGTLKIKELFDTEAMQKIGAVVWNGSYPHCEKYKMWSEDYVKCFIQNAAFPGQHVCCTCAMGNGTGAVVDHRLRLLGGVKNVRVADASVMPEIVSGNPYAAVMMIGEKAATMIIEDAIAADNIPMTKGSGQ